MNSLSRDQMDGAVGSLLSAGGYVTPISRKQAAEETRYTMSNEQLDRIESKLNELLAVCRGQKSAPPAEAVRADIDGPHGDPSVRFVPKHWSGTDYKGAPYSTCEPAFLEMLADSLEYFAKKDDESGAVDKNGNPKSKWGRLDAARARAWAERNRQQPPRVQRGSVGEPDDDLPFL